MPQDKRKLTEAEAGMAKSLTKLNTPLTKKEELQAVAQRAALIKQRKMMESKQPKSPSAKPVSSAVKNMLTVPSIAKRFMEKKAENIKQKKLDMPTSTKRVVGVFSMKKK